MGSPKILVSVLFACMLWQGSAPLKARAESGHSEKIAALMARAGQVAKDVAKLRGLALKRNIDRGVMNKAEIKARILKILAREYTPEELAAESLGMKRLGLIPEDMDYVKVMVGMLEEQIAGFYDQHEKKLYVAGWAQAGGDMLMAHEIDHALQDQHFDLTKFMAPNKKNGDSVLARQALVEGDGMALMLEFQMASMNQTPPWGNPMIMGLLKSGMSQGAAAMKGVPLALREGLMFPYLGGVEFIAHFRKNKGWSAIDAVYRKPPLSTEQILHPKKYESYEKPLQVRSKRPTSLSGYSTKVSNVIGEKGVELFLRSNGVETGRAVAAAAGWGGDRLEVYARKGHKGSDLDGTVGVWMTAWDSEADASEFFQALEFALPTLTRGPRVDNRGPVMQFAGEKRFAEAERRGETVLLVIDNSNEGLAAIGKAAWANWHVRGQSRRK